MEQSEEKTRKEQARKRLEARQQRTRNTRTLPKTSAQEALRKTRSSAQRTHSEQQKFSAGHLFTGMLESYGLKFIVVLAVIALLVLSFLAGTFLRSCANAEEPNQNAPSTASMPSAASSASSASSTPSATSSVSTASAASTDIPSNTSSASSAATSNSSANQQNIVGHIAELALQKKEEAQENTEEPEDISNVLEDALAEKLLAQAKINADAAWIAANPSEYALDGWAVQYKILKLAAEEPLARTYVRNWPDEYPAAEQNTQSRNAIAEVTTGPHNVPQLFQWDPRWGYTVYSSTSFGMTGCCPTAFAMVYQGLTNKSDMTPYDMGVLAENDGYMSEYEGTDAYFLVNEAAGLGLSCYEIYFAPESIVAALEAGQVLIANVGPGDFTTDGHFIVITGMKDGQLIVNDPYSKVRSDKLWDPQDIIDQSRTIFAFALAS